MSTPQLAPIRHRYARVLVVDDDPDVRELIQDSLERRGFEVIAVESGADALAYLARGHVDLILLDLEMDDVDGWEVLTALQRHPAFASLRVVVVSGASGSVPKWASYMRKPFRVDKLLALLDGDPSAVEGAPRPPKHGQGEQR